MLECSGVEFWLSMTSSKVSVVVCEVYYSLLISTIESFRVDCL